MSGLPRLVRLESDSRAFRWNNLFERCTGGRFSSWVFHDLPAAKQPGKLRFYCGLQQQLFEYQPFKTQVSIHAVFLDDV